MLPTPFTASPGRAKTGMQAVDPSRPAFLAEAPIATNVTGDGTTYTIVFSTEDKDQGGDFDGTSTFTAPVTGPYWLSAVVHAVGITASETDFRLELVTSNETLRMWLFNPTGIDNGGSLMVCASHMFYMDAGDTAHVVLRVLNGAIVDIHNDTGAGVSKFAGFLVA